MLSTGSFIKEVKIYSTCTCKFLLAFILIINNMIKTVLHQNNITC